MKLPTPDIIAREFCRQLLKAIGPKKLALAVRRNVRRNDGSCATHDFCDANVVMDAAFEKITGKDTDALSRATDPHFKGEGCMSDDVHGIWCDAWSLANAAKFKTADVGKIKLYTVLYCIEVQAASPKAAALETLEHIRNNGNEAVFQVKKFTGKDTVTAKGFTPIDLSLS